MSLVPRFSAEWRAALFGAAVGVALTLPAAFTEQEAVGLLVAGVVAGYLAPRDANAYVAGARAGIVTAVPLAVWFLLANVDWFALQDSMAFELAAAVLMTAFVLGVGYLAGGIGAGFGGWLAVQFGRKEPA